MKYTSSIQNSLYIPSTFSSLSGATSEFTSPRRRRLGAPSPASKLQRAPSEFVLFDYKGHIEQGVPMSELLDYNPSKLATIIAGAGDHVLADHWQHPQQSIQVVWAGYPDPKASYSCAISVVDPNGVPITRASLGAKVSRHVYANAADRPGVIQFENLVLVSLYHVRDGIWQADIAHDAL
ncbi:hypothetical protein H1R20_g9515, partial [Candolleomyces eurysporus]